tara:strand:- start:73 stop:636 length:564 start_codon:yes stop_codon:yes gene_type:complete
MANVEPNFDEELILPSGKSRSMFESRIPGQSLTEEPGKWPYENPPQYTDADEVMTMYMSRLTDDTTMFNLFRMLEAKLPVAQIVNGMILQGIGEGLYSPDVGIIIMEDLVLLIINVAEEAEIDYVTGYENEAEKTMLKLAKQVAGDTDIEPEQIEAGKQAVETEMQKQEGGEEASGLMSKPMDVEEQ